MKMIAELNRENVVMDCIRSQKSEDELINIKLLKYGDAIGVLIMSMDDIDEIIRKTHGPDTDAWFLLSEEQKQDCAARLMRNVFDGVKDQIEYAIADNYAIQMALPPPTLR